MGRTSGAGMAIHLGRSLPNASRDRPERRRERPARRRRHCRRPPAAPTWSCSRWGFPCRRRCRQRGALLPHHFTLAARRFVISEPVGARRYVFCGTFPGVAPAGRYPAPCLRGARTFLPSRHAKSGHPTVWHGIMWETPSAIERRRRTVWARHSRASGNPGASAPAVALDPRFRGGDGLQGPRYRFRAAGHSANRLDPACGGRRARTAAPPAPG